MGNCCGQDASVDEEASKGRNPRDMRRNICCTDIVVLFIFIAYWCLLLYIAVVSMVRGDPKRVVYGFDSSGNTCNQKYNAPIANLSHSGMDTEGKSFVFFFSVVHPKHAIQICISKCPNRMLETKEDVVNYYKETKISLCQYGVMPSVNLAFDRRGPCPSLPIYPSLSILSRCVPNPKFIVNSTSKLQILSSYDEMFQVEDFLTKVLSDLTLCWREMIGMAFVALAMGFLMVLMMRFLSFIIVWLIVILSVIGSIVGTILLWCCFAAWATDDGTDPFMVPLVGTSLKKRSAYLGLAILATIFTVILLLVLFILRKRIGLVVALFKEAGKCLAGVPFLLAQPFLTFLIYLIVTFYFVFIFACMSNMGTPIAREKNGLTKVKFEKVGFEKYFWVFHLIGWIWTSEFVLACQEYVISSSVAIWYFSPNRGWLTTPILSSISTLIMHHLGSIAFGSLIITIVKVLRYILMYIDQKCRASENDCAQFCLKCCMCCLWCLEKVLKFLHQNAYTVMAIEGTNFCTSARKAFEIIASNALRVAAINSVGDFVLFLGKVGVMCLSGLCAFFWFRTIPNLYYVPVPVFIVCVFSFLIAHVFLSVYEMVVDALLICFCEDSNRNDGTDGREYYMSDSLKEFVTDSSAKLEALNSKGKQQGPVDEDTSLNN